MYGAASPSAVNGFWGTVMKQSATFGSSATVVDWLAADELVPVVFAAATCDRAVAKKRAMQIDLPNIVMMKNAEVRFEKNVKNQIKDSD